ncbi:hypothetical protein OF83DRAFT_1173607 [Amylostereum chailletii]|nr:hypothetical protein OF83DRAFT_1173607 [Amylostereum chailletii]
MLIRILPLAILAITLSPVIAAMSNFTYERLDKSKAMLLVVDHQEGLYLVSRDMNAIQMKNKSSPMPNSGSSEMGPNGPLPAEVIAMHSDAPLIKRQGEVNAWDNPDFKAAVEAAGRPQIILAGVRNAVYETGGTA